jgi:hypothetical protein
VGSDVWTGAGSAGTTAEILSCAPPDIAGLKTPNQTAARTIAAATIRKSSTAITLPDFFLLGAGARLPELRVRPDEFSCFITILL